MVTVWQVSLARASVALPDHLENLSFDERARARQFVRAVDCASFVMVRSVLRSLLGKQLHQSAASIRFQRSRGGKPSLERESPLRFSVAHSDDLAYIAVADDGRELGVDVEAWREMSTDEMASVLTPQERRTLLPAAHSRKPFFDLWTRKEAILKTNGAGLGGIASASGTIVDVAAMAEFMHVENLPAGPGHSAALAVDCRTASAPPFVQLRKWSG